MTLSTPLQSPEPLDQDRVEAESSDEQGSKVESAETADSGHSPDKEPDNSGHSPDKEPGNEPRGRQRRPRPPRTPVDPDLQRAVLDVLPELDPRHRLPFAELRKIAEDTVRAEKVTDGEWIFERIQESKKEFRRKRNVARIRGYAPFVSLNQRVYRKMLETFGDDILDLMKKYLSDPEDIYTKWAYRFASVVQEIGVEACVAHKEEIYHYVTNHGAWERCGEGFAARFNEWINEGRPAEAPESAEPTETSEPEAGSSDEAPAVTEEPAGTPTEVADS